MESKKPKKSLTEILKQGDKQKLLTYSAYVVIILVSTFISAYQVEFDVSQITSWAFLGNLLFNYAVAIIGLFVGIQDAERHYEQTTKSQYYLAKVEYKKAKDKLYETKTNVLFADYVVYRYKKEQFIEMQNLFIEKSIPIEVIDLPENLFNLLQYQSIAYYGNYQLIESSEEANKLRKEDIKTTEIYKLTEEQYEFALEVRTKGVNLPSLKYSEFLNESGSSDWRDIAYKERHKKSIKRWGFTYRAVMLLLISAIISMAVVELNDAPVGKVLTDIANRLFNLITSIVFAYSIARTEDNMNKDICIYKTSIILDCISETQTGAWKKESVSEKVYQELDKIKEENEKVEVVESAPVIIPNTNEPLQIKQADEIEVDINEWEEYQKWKIHQSNQ